MQIWLVGININSMQAWQARYYFGSLLILTLNLNHNPFPG